MGQDTLAAPRGTARPDVHARAARIDTLLVCGMVVGPLFPIVAAIQALAVEGSTRAASDQLAERRGSRVGPGRELRAGRGARWRSRSGRAASSTTVRVGPGARAARRRPRTDPGGRLHGDPSLGFPPGTPDGTPRTSAGTPSPTASGSRSRSSRSRWRASCSPGGSRRSDGADGPCTRSRRRSSRSRSACGRTRMARACGTSPRPWSCPRGRRRSRAGSAGRISMSRTRPGTEGSTRGRSLRGCSCRWTASPSRPRVGRSRTSTTSSGRRWGADGDLGRDPARQENVRGVRGVLAGRGRAVRRLHQRDAEVRGLDDADVGGMEELDAAAGRPRRVGRRVEAGAGQGHLDHRERHAGADVARRGPRRRATTAALSTIVVGRGKRLFEGLRTRSR